MVPIFLWPDSRVWFVLSDEAYPILGFRAPVSLPTGCESTYGTTDTLLTAGLSSHFFCCEGFPSGCTASSLLCSQVDNLKEKSSVGITAGLGLIIHCFVTVSHHGCDTTFVRVRNQVTVSTWQGTCRPPSAFSWSVTNARITLKH